MIVNLTLSPMTVVIDGWMGTIMGTIQPSGKVAQVTLTETEVEIDGAKVPFAFTEIVDLPDPDGLTRYIVGPRVKEEYPDRDDLLVPWHFASDRAGNVLVVKPAET
jgi:hypothetical protein